MTACVLSHFWDTRAVEGLIDPRVGTKVRRMKSLQAALTAFLGYVPTVKEIRRALARPGVDDGTPDGLPRSTHNNWVKSGEDRSVASLYNVASFYDGRKDYADRTISGEALRGYLEEQFGYRMHRGGDEDGDPHSHGLAKGGMRVAGRIEDQARGFIA